ncbi:MAG: hypothetical protein GQ534_09835 [Candidatus Delongbacteria bacterium]|nr:hypothetical protein [Candidatus Delongbacteria bacterium]
MTSKFAQNKLFFILILLVVSGIYAQGTALKVAGYPTSLTTGIPISISSGIGATTIAAVTGIQISDRSTNGWTLTITSANGTSTQPRLQHEINGTTIDYYLEINNVTGTLAPGLTLDPPVNTTLIFNANSTLISPLGTSAGRTNKFMFDLRISIANAATVGKLAGNYVDQLTLVLASDD